MIRAASARPESTARLAAGADAGLEAVASDTELHRLIVRTWFVDHR